MIVIFAELGSSVTMLCSLGSIVSSTKKYSLNSNKESSVIATEKELRFTDLLNTNVLLRPSEKSLLAVGQHENIHCDSAGKLDTNNCFLSAWKLLKGTTL